MFSLQYAALDTCEFR